MLIIPLHEKYGMFVQSIHLWENYIDRYEKELISRIFVIERKIFQRIRSEIA